MPAYNFQERFAAAVETGAKRQTIRRPRRRRLTRPGDTLYLYTGMRTQRCRRLLVTECRAVSPLQLHHGWLTLGDEILEEGDERVAAVAQADGFASAEEFWAFFERLYGLPVELEIIEW